MADMELGVDASDLAAAKELLGSLATEFARTVSKIESDSKRMDNVAKTTRATFETAFDKVIGQALQRDVEQARGFWQRYEQQIGITGKRASEAGATFDKLGSVIANQAKQNTQYWDDFGERVGLVGSRATEAGATFSRLGQIIENEAKQAIAYWDAFNERVGVNGVRANQSGAPTAGNSALAEQAMKEEAALERLRLEYAPLQAAQERYEQGLRELKMLQDSNKISATEYAQALNRLQSELQQTQTRVAANGQAVNQFGVLANFSGKDLNTFGMRVQQTGYQVGDFFVQVASGQNVMVAFSQQMSQLLGMFGVGGAIAGAIVAVGAAIAIPFMKASEEADKLNVSLDFLDELPSVMRIASQSMETSFTSSINAIRASFGEFEGQIAEFRMNQIKGGIEGAIGEGPGSASGFWGSLFSPGQLQSREAERNAATVTELFSNLDYSSIGALAESYDEAFLKAMELTGQNEQIRAQLIGIAEELGIADEIWGNLNGEAERQARLVEEAGNFLRENVRDMDQRLAIMQAEAQFGSDSVEALAVRQAIERENLALQASRLGLGESERAVLMDMLATIQDIETSQTNVNAAVEAMRRELGDAYTTAVLLAGVDIASGIAAAAQQAYALAGGLSAALSNAMSLSSIGGISSGGIVSRVAGGIGGALGAVRDFAWSLPTPEFAGPRPGIRPQSFIVEDGVPDWAAPPVRGGRGGRGGGGGSGPSPAEIAEDIAEAMAEINEETDWIERMAGLNEEERRHAETMKEIMDQFGDNVDQVSEDTLEALTLERIAAEDLLEAAENAQEATERMVDSIVDGFTGAVLSVVEGTESVNDAFRGMLRDMILDIYKQKVMEPFADYAGNFLMGLFSANGNAFGPSGHISYFAKGDMFNSPTAFQFGGGKLGIMGEAGPEAVMPLKRGPDGKLGVQASGTGEFHQHIHWHIAANGDESVKKIIRQESPKVAEMSKNQVLKEIRNGGSYGKAVKGR